jgi:hypothetical protein
VQGQSSWTPRTPSSHSTGCGKDSKNGEKILSEWPYTHRNIKGIQGQVWGIVRIETSFFFFLVVLEFGLRISCLLGRHSIISVMPLALFALVIFRLGSCILAPVLNCDSSTYISPVAGIINMDHHAHITYLLRWDLTNFFSWAGFELQSAWVTGIIHVSHCIWSVKSGLIFLSLMIEFRFSSMQCFYRE